MVACAGASGVAALIALHPAARRLALNLANLGLAGFLGIAGASAAIGVPFDTSRTRNAPNRSNIVQASAGGSTDNPAPAAPVGHEPDPTPEPAIADSTASEPEDTTDPVSAEIDNADPDVDADPDDADPMAATASDEPPATATGPDEEPEEASSITESDDLTIEDIDDEDVEDTGTDEPDPAEDTSDTDAADLAPAPDSVETTEPSNVTSTLPAPGPSQLQPVEALPVDVSEKRSAIRERLRFAKSVVDDAEQCVSAQAVGQAWAQLEAIPPADRDHRVRVLARKLEACRKKVFWSVRYLVHRSRVEAREAFIRELDGQERTGDNTTTTRVYGRNHQRMRIGVHGPFNQTIADQLLTAELRERAQALGFDIIVVSQRDESYVYRLQPRPETDYVNLELVPFGLDQPLD